MKLFRQEVVVPARNGKGSRRLTCCLATLLLLFAPLPVVATDAVDTDHQPHPYTRVASPDADTDSLQIALRRFVPREGKGPAIWLTAVSHIGDTNYYSILQKHLDGLDLVLFEGVGAASLQEGGDGAESVEVKSGEGDEEEKPELGTVQSTLAESLGLKFQLEAINYKRKHFRNSDMTMYQLQWLMNGGSETNMPSKDWEPKPGKPMPIPEGAREGEGNRDFETLLNVMDGSSMMGMMVDSALRFIGSSPKLQALTRLMFIQTLGKMQGDMAEMEGLPPGMLELIKVLIRGRNKVVVSDVKEALKELGPGDEISVFYGAGHMDDLEKRLFTEIDYQQDKEIWLDAFSVDTKAAGVTKFEKQMINYFVNVQMQMLNQGKAKPAAAEGESEGGEAKDDD